MTLDIETKEAWDLITRYILRGEAITSQALVGAKKKVPGRIAVLSALPHEIRHFHDFLLSPEGAAIVRTRLVTAINSLQLLLILQKTGVLESATHIPAPLTVWWRQSPAQQEATETRWSGLSERWGGTSVVVPRISVSRPDLTLDDIRNGTELLAASTIPDLVNIVDASYRRLDRYVAGWPVQSDNGLRFENRHILEASASIVQVQWVYEALGVEAAQVMVNGLLNKRTSKYGLAANLAFRAILLDSSRARSSDLLTFEYIMEPMAAIFNWALLGQHRSEDAAGSPARRFIRLVGGMLKENRFIYIDGDLRGTYRLWDRRTNEPDTLAELERSVELDRRSILGVMRFRKKAGGAPIGVFMDKFIQWDEQFAKARRLMVTRFLESPRNFVNPHLYDASLRKLPAPPLQIRVSGGLLGGDAQELENSGWILHRFQRSVHESGKVAVRATGPPVDLVGEGLISRSLAFDVAEIFVTLDVLLSSSRGNIDSAEKELAADNLDINVAFIDVMEADFATRCTEG